MEYSIDDDDFKFWIITVTIFITLLSIVVFLLFGRIGIEILSLIATSLLTLALVFLYFHQSTILDKQVQLMNKGYQSILSTQRGSIIADGDRVSIPIRNTGRGKILSIYLKSEITSDTGDLDIVFDHTLLTDENGSPELPSNSDLKKFDGKVTLRVLSWDRSEIGYPFRTVSRYLAMQGFTSCTLKLTLEVYDEAISDNQFTYDAEIAEQELFLIEPKVEEREGDEVTIYPSTTIEEGIEHMFSSAQDINRVPFEEIDVERT